MTFSPFWIWQNTADINDNVISWCSQQDYGVVSADLPDNSLSGYLHATFIGQLRDGERSLALSDLVGNDIASTLAEWILYHSATKILYIHLVHTLPEVWQKLPLEWCQHKGKSLCEYVQIIRYAPLPKQAFTCSMASELTLFNVWPKRDKQVFESIFSAFNHTPIGRKKCRIHFSGNNVSNQSMLCVIAHGNECDAEKPFLSECKQHAWAFPSKHLPPLVLLLACGGEQGNLRDYAIKLLQDKPDQEEGAVKTAYGAKTVLVALGKLDASPVLLFMQAFIEKWQAGQPVNQILYQLQHVDYAEHAAKRMQIIGQSDLRQLTNKENKQADVSQTWAELKINAKTDDNALIMLLNCLTQHRLMSYSSVESIAEKLYEALAYPYNNPNEQADLLYKRLNHIYQHCNDLTKVWLSGFLMSQSAVYEHNNMARYEQEIFKYEAIVLPNNTHIPLYIAQAKYRERNHVKATQVLVEGFNTFAKNEQRGREVEYRLAGLAVNILIDMSLTDIATYFATHATHCIETSLLTNGKKYAEEIFIHRDRTARLATRIGDPDNEEKGEAGLKKCIRALDAKRYQAINDFDYDGERELSALLIFSAWIEKPNLSYINIVLEILADIDQISSQISCEKGNIGKLYLLKGLANWAWQQEDKNAAKLLIQYTPTFIMLCHQHDKQDAGPLGSIIACMRLMGHDNDEMRDAWNAISEKMYYQFHYFELTMFSALFKQEKKSAQYYKEFRIQQKNVLCQLNKLELGILDSEFYDLVKEAEEGIYYQPMNKGGGTFNCDLDVMRRWGLVPF